MAPALQGVFAVVQAAGFVLGAPAVAGCLRWMRARRCRVAAPSVLQPYRDLHKLFAKHRRTSQQTPLLGALGVVVPFAALVAAGAMVPLFFRESLGHLLWGSDLILLSGLLLLAKFAQTLAAVDTTSAFAALGAGRVMLVHSIAEPTLLLVFMALALDRGSTDLGYLFLSAPPAVAYALPGHLTALLALALAALMECGRMPYDNPATHLELTMIERAARIEWSGAHLALCEWTDHMKLALLAFLTGNVALRVIEDVSGTLPEAVRWGLVGVCVLGLLWLVAWNEMRRPRHRVADLPSLGVFPKALALFAMFYFAVTRLVSGG